MKKALFSALVLVAALASCSKKQDTVPVLPSEDVKMVPVTFTAGVETKTHLGNDGHSVIWQNNDAISVFANGNNYKFTLASGHGSSSASFTGEMSETDAAASEFFALYPYDATATIAEGVITTKGISNNVNNVTNNIPNNYVQSVAHADGSNFEFKIVCAMMKVVVPADMAGLLKNIMISCNAGASAEPLVGGTASITVSDTPTVTLAGASGDVQTSKNAGIEAGTYYFPVYPTPLSKGLRVKLQYVDNRTPEYLFTGKQLELKRAAILNVGTVHPQPSYVFDDFESYDISTSGKTNLGVASYLKGNDNALWIVENPYPSETNSSAKVLANDMHTATWGTSGYVQMSFGYDTIKLMFPYAARDKFKGVRFKVYIGASDYYPTLQIDAGNSSGNKFPSKVNGVATGGDAAVYASNLRHDDWNVLEFNLATCGFSGSFTTHFGNLNNWQFRPFVTSSKGSCDAALSETNLKICYIDDVEFLYD